MSGNASSPANDEGLGLIELLVAIVVSTLVLLGIGSVLINSWNTQNDVLSTSEATNRGQLISSSIERAMRNALLFKVEGGGTELWVHTTLTGERECLAFKFSDGPDDGDGNAQMKSGAGLDLEPWGSWLDATSYSQFEVDVTVPVSGVFFSGSGDTVSYAFEVTTDSAPVQFAGEATARFTSTEGSSPCW